MGDTLDQLEEKNERRRVEVSIAEQEALIRELKKRHGSSWRDHLPNVKSGLDWSALKFRL